MFCTNCGKRIPDDANFCNYCGSKIEIIIDDNEVIAADEDNSAAPENAIEEPEVAGNTTITISTVEDNSVNESTDSNTFTAENNQTETIDSHNQETTSNEQITQEEPSTEQKKNSYSWLPTIIAFVLIFAGTKACHYQRQKKIEERVMRYVEKEYGSLENVAAGKHEGSQPRNRSNQSNSTSSHEAEFRKIMLETVEECNRDYPESLGYGMKITKCELKDKTLLYICVWDGVSRSDITPDFISDMRKAYQESIKEQYQESSVLEKQIFVNMKKYGYQYCYKWVDNEGRDLFTVSVPIDY